MLETLALSLALSAGGSPLVAYEVGTCPPLATATGAAAREAADRARSACFFRALQAELSNAEGPAAAELRGEEPRFEGWARAACALTEELAGRDGAAAVGAALREACLQSSWAERAFLARTLSTFDPGAPPESGAFGVVVLSRQAMGAAVRLELSRLLGALRAGTLSGGAALSRRIDAVWQGALDLAQRACATRGEGSLCVSRLENYGFSLVNPYPGGRAPGQGG